MNKTWKTSIDNLEKNAEFLPSLFNAPDNHWTPDSDKEIALNPDSVSDDETLYGEWWQDKPRNSNMWNEFMSMFRNPFSKKEDMTINSDYDPELEQREKDALGEDQTLLEYSKGFYDPKKHDFPHNTTWDSLTQDGEPSKPTSVTYSPQISNEDNLDQNSPGGFPRRFMGKPKGEWFSNEGEVNEFLINMLRNREAAIDRITRDITADLSEKGFWVDPNGKFYTVRTSGSGFDVQTHSAWVRDNRDMLKELYPSMPTSSDGYAEYDFLLNNGWVRIGDSFGSDYAIESNDPFNLPSSVLDWANSNLSSVQIGKTGINSYNKYITVQLPVDDLQEAINNEFKLTSIAKKASIEEVNGIKVLVNPSPNEVKAFFRKGSLRALIDPDTGDMFAWDAAQSEHDRIIRFFGLPIDWETDDGTYIRHVASPVDIDELFQIQQDVREKLRRKKKPEILPAMKLKCHNCGGPLQPQELFQKQKVTKQASSNVQDIRGIKVFKNPSIKQIEQIFLASKEPSLRYYISPDNSLFVWDGFSAIHDVIIDGLGYEVEDRSFDDPDSSSCGQVFNIQDAKKLARNYSVAGNLKQAGDQSASVPDYLDLLTKDITSDILKEAGSYSSTYTDEQGEEMYNEQHMNDTDQVPYTNFDQRDYPFGMHDSPENTGYNIGWPKDNQPYVVRLDILENPAYRLDPFGIGEYNVTYFSGMPNDDGLEQMNPE